MKRPVTTKKDIGKITGFFIVLTIYFIAFTHYGSMVLEPVFPSNNTFKEGTAIGSKNISGKKKTDTVRMLNRETEQWYEQAELRFQYREKTAVIETNLIEFQVEKSVREAVNGQSNKMKAIVSKKQLQEVLNEKFPTVNSNTLNLALLASDVSNVGNYLKTSESVIDLTMYSQEKEKIAVVSKVLQEDITDEISRFIEKHPKILVKSHDTFSFNQWIEKINHEDLGEKHLNKLSSALFQLVMHTDFIILEKNQGTERPSYIKLGYEAKVDKEKNQDFTFTNGNSTDYTIEWKEQDGKLAVALKGLPFYYSYQPAFKNKQVLESKTIRRFSPNLEYGTMRVERFGEDGEMIDVYRTVFEGTKKQKDEKIAEDFYPPIHQVEVYSSQDPPQEKEADEEKQKEEDA